MNRYALAALVLLAAPILGAPASQQPKPAPALPASWTLCASEGGTCNFSGTAEVRYGTGNAFAARTLTGTVACGNAAFGDPVYGVAKSCWYRAVAATPSTAPTQPATATAVGMNLTSPSYWATSHPFIDRAKVGHWYLADAAGWRDAPNLNAQGFPSSVPARAQMALMLGVDPIELGTSDRYVLTYKGTVTISTIGSARIVSAQPGRIVFDATAATPFVVVDAISAGDPLREIHVVRDDQVAAFEAGEIFNTPFLDNAKRFPVLRMMDWSLTNHSRLANVEDMPNVGDATWAQKGVPLDIQIALANQAGSDLWINVPVRATDDYVRTVMTRVRDTLSPRLRVHLEYSNEVWNWMFEQTSYAQSQADVLWQSRAAEFGTWSNSATPRINGGNMMYYGYRATQIARIARDVFGGANLSRLACVIATQTAYQGLEDYIFKGIMLAGVTAPSSLFEEYAITTYFGDELSGQSAEDRQTVVSWARGGAAGMTIAFAEIENGGKLKDNLSLAVVGALFDYHGKVAAKRGLKLVAYEGSLSATATNYQGQEKADVVAFLQRMVDDPRMATLYTKMGNRFFAAGGKELTAFADAGMVSEYGTWGMLNTIFTPTARNNAMAAFNGR